ncbi:uncharacterized protein N0V89_011496 [Didymosphaeria variabile]|uniref:Glycosyltransferase family 34 protein n=1 Tax=Didymosphaeria variabile TaxID=1932322 RepID=A0A9W8XA49_9PLEO|nr:uncharacterized protein N0V89_011496 [Didymosphaeria variabile]KAJ4345366.1 hypothetical protein N0V89_011496 [Didymosphaeria variabile]
MLVRSLRIPPTLLLLLVFSGFLGWHFSQSPLPDLAPAPRPPPPPPAERKPATAVEKKPSAAVVKQKPAPASPKKPLRVALVTFVTEERSYLHISLKSKDHYVRRHGYDLIVDYEAHTKDKGTVWWKFDMIRRLIKKDKWDWIWWLDFDTLITNTDIKVADIIEETLKNATTPAELDYLFSNDCNNLNLGSFIVRSHERSLKFLDDVYAVEAAVKKADPEAQLSEQDAITKLMEQDPASKKRSTVIPQWMINSFPDEIPCYEEPERPWKKGHFLVHFAGAWAHVKGTDPTGQLMKKYKDEIIWGDWKGFY